MPRRPMTPAEKMVGRRYPPEASRLDQILAGFVRADGTLCDRMPPGEPWMRPAFLKARRSGLVRHSGITIKMEGDRNALGIWHLTEKGEAEARDAVARVKAAKDERTRWAIDHQNAFREWRRRDRPVVD